MLIRAQRRIPTPLVGLDVSSALIAAGFHVVGPFTTCADTANHCTADLAACAIDYQLADCSSEGLILRLRSYNVPILLVTGADNIPAHFDGTPRIGKPTTADQVVAAVRELCERR